MSADAMRPLWGGWQKPGAADSRPLGFRAFAKCPEKMEGGYQKSATPNRPTPHVLARRENFPPLKSIKFQQIMAEHGGRRKGAGRPLGSRNRPRLIHGLPETNDPLEWLLALMNHPGAPLRLRMSAAKALLPYFHARMC